MSEVHVNSSIVNDAIANATHASSLKTPNRLTQLLNEAPIPRALPVMNGPTFTGLQASVIEQAVRLENQADLLEREAVEMLSSALFGVNALTTIRQDRLLAENVGASAFTERMEGLRRKALDYAHDLRTLRDTLRGEAKGLREMAEKMARPVTVAVPPVHQEPVNVTTGDDLRPFSLAHVPGSIIMNLAKQVWNQKRVNDWCSSKNMQAPGLTAFSDALMTRYRDEKAKLEEEDLGFEEETFKCGSCDELCLESDRGGQSEELGVICKDCVEEAKESEARAMSEVSDTSDTATDIEDFGEALVDDSTDEQPTPEDKEIKEFTDNLPPLVPVPEKAKEFVLDKAPNAKVRTKGKGRKKMYKIMVGTRNLTDGYYSSEDTAWLNAADKIPNW